MSSLNPVSICSREGYDARLQPVRNWQKPVTEDPNAHEVVSIGTGARERLRQHSHAAMVHLGMQVTRAG